MSDLLKEAREALRAFTGWVALDVEHIGTELIARIRVDADEFYAPKRAIKNACAVLAKLEAAGDRDGEAFERKLKEEAVAANFSLVAGHAELTDNLRARIALLEASLKRAGRHILATADEAHGGERQHHREAAAEIVIVLQHAAPAPPVKP